MPSAREGGGNHTSKVRRPIPREANRSQEGAKLTLILRPGLGTCTQ